MADQRASGLGYRKDILKVVHYLERIRGLNIVQNLVGDLAKYQISKTAGALVRHRACIVPLWLVSGYWCSGIAIPVT